MSSIVIVIQSWFIKFSIDFAHKCLDRFAALLGPKYLQETAPMCLIVAFFLSRLPSRYQVHASAVALYRPTHVFPFMHDALMELLPLFCSARGEGAVESAEHRNLKARGILQFFAHSEVLWIVALCASILFLLLGVTHYEDNIPCVAILLLSMGRSDKGLRAVDVVNVRLRRVACIQRA